MVQSQEIQSVVIFLVSHNKTELASTYKTIQRADKQSYVTTIIQKQLHGLFHVELYVQQDTPQTGRRHYKKDYRSKIYDFIESATRDMLHCV